MSEADSERLADLRGFLMRELDRARGAGADSADLIATLCDALGEVLADTRRADISPILPVLASQILRAHIAGVRRRLEQPAAAGPRLVPSD